MSQSAEKGAGTCEPKCHAYGIGCGCTQHEAAIAARQWVRIVDDYRDADTIDQATTDELVRVGNLLLDQIESHKCPLPPEGGQS